MKRYLRKLSATLISVIIFYFPRGAQAATAFDPRLERYNIKQLSPLFQKINVPPADAQAVPDKTDDRMSRILDRLRNGYYLHHEVDQADKQDLRRADEQVAETLTAKNLEFMEKHVKEFNPNVPQSQVNKYMRIYVIKQALERLKIFLALNQVPREEVSDTRGSIQAIIVKCMARQSISQQEHKTAEEALKKNSDFGMMMNLARQAAEKGQEISITPYNDELVGKESGFHAINNLQPDMRIILLTYKNLQLLAGWNAAAQFDFNRTPTEQ